MKAHISQTGTLHITPENDTEAYALAQWRRASYASGEACYHGPSIVIRQYEDGGAKWKGKPVSKMTSEELEEARREYLGVLHADGKI